MTSWGDSRELAELLDRQFAHVLELQGTIQIFGLRKLVSFVQDEPLLGAVLDDLRIEANDVLLEYEASDQAVRSQLSCLWASHGSELQARLAGVTDDALTVFGTLATFDEALAKTSSIHFEVERYDSQLRQTSRLIEALQHWCKWARDIAKGTPLDTELTELSSALLEVEATFHHAARRVYESGKCLGWPAYERILKNVQATNPLPPSGEESHEWGNYHLDMKLAKTLSQADVEHVGVVERIDIDEVYAAIKSDVVALREELQLRIGLRRSRLGLVKRYAAGCEAFRAEHLRTLAEPSKSPEAVLTLDFARYLFEAGLNPLLDPTASGLRPDILHVDPSALFYVEAKQYKDKYPRATLKKAYGQVWSTWARLQKVYPSKEAFLVVFRRGGPWVSLPELVTHNGLKLYSILADISTEAGSREKHAPISITADEVKPQEEAS